MEIRSDNGWDGAIKCACSLIYLNLKFFWTQNIFMLNKYKQGNFENNY